MLKLKKWPKLLVQRSSSDLHRRKQGRTDLVMTSHPFSFADKSLNEVTDVLDVVVDIVGDVIVDHRVLVFEYNVVPGQMRELLILTKILISDQLEQ